MQRIGWVIMALLLLAMVLGLLGGGLLSHTTVGAGSDPLSLEFDRFAHLQAPTTLKAHVGANAGSEDEVRLWLNRQYLERVEIQSITPEPDSVEATAARMLQGLERMEQIKYAVLERDGGITVIPERET